MQTDLQMWSAVHVSLMEAANLARADRSGVVVISPATERWLRASARRLAGFLGGDRELDRVTPREVQAWVQWEFGRGVSAVYVNSLLRGVKTLYGRLQKNGIVSVNPAEPVRFVAEPRLSPKGILEDDYRAMASAATNSRDRAILAVLWDSGCRLGGLLSMRVDRMERWNGPGGWPQFALLVVEKGDRPRMVYVGRSEVEGRALAAWLDARPAMGPPGIFLAFDVPLRVMSAVAVQHVLRRLRQAARIPKDRPSNAHSFRHGFAIRMLDEGEDLAAVSQWLGHHSPEFTAARYAVRPEWALREKFFSR